MSDAETSTGWNIFNTKMPCPVHAYVMLFALRGEPDNMEMLVDRDRDGNIFPPYDPLRREVGHALMALCDAYKVSGALKSKETFAGGDGGTTEDEHTLVILAYYFDASELNPTRGEFMPISQVLEKLGEIPVPLSEALRNCRLGTLSQEDFEKHLDSMVTRILRDADYKDAQGNPL